MSYNIHAIFKIKRDQFTKELLATIVEAIYNNRKIPISKSEIAEIAEITYENTLGDYSRHTALFKNNTPYPCVLITDTHEKAKKYSPPMDIPKDTAYIKLSVPMTQFDDNRQSEAMLTGAALRKAFVSDAKAVYSVVHPEWGAIAMDLEISELMISSPAHDPSDFLFPVNFYGPKIARKVEKKKISGFEPEKIEELDGGGLLIQFGEFLNIAVMRDNEIPGEIRMKQMAKALAAMTGQNVWWKGHEKRFGLED